MSRNRALPYLFAALIALAGLAGAGATSVLASAPAAAAKKHPKKKHPKKKHHSATPPKSSKPKLEGCSAIVSGAGPTAEMNLYNYQVILGCSRGEFGSFTVSTNRAVVAGSITAKIGGRFTYTCQQASPTSFSCSGVNAEIPPGEEGAAIRAFFKSTQAVCIGGSPESATVATQGLTFNATIAEAQGSC